METTIVLRPIAPRSKSHARVAVLPPASAIAAMLLSIPAMLSAILIARAMIGAGLGGH